MKIALSAWTESFCAYIFPADAGPVRKICFSVVKTRDHMCSGSESRNAAEMREGPQHRRTYLQWEDKMGAGDVCLARIQGTDGRRSSLPDRRSLGVGHPNGLSEVDRLAAQSSDLPPSCSRNNSKLAALVCSSDLLCELVDRLCNVVFLCYWNSENPHWSVSSAPCCWNG